MKKKILLILTLLTIVCMLFAFVACKGPNSQTPDGNEPNEDETVDKHEHTFATTWSIDETYHWYASTCGHSEAEEKIKHTFDENDVCTVCKLDGSYGLKYDKSSFDFYIVTGVKEGNASSDIVIPSTYKGLAVKRIDSDAFLGNSNVKSVVIPDSIADIFGSAFKDCVNLTSVTFGENIKLTIIYPHLFEGCSKLTEIEIPNRIQSIGESAFSGCVSLKNIVFDKNSELEYFSDDAFKGCVSLKSIQFPKSLKIFNNLAFEGCDNLETIELNEGNKRYKSEGNCIIEKDGNKLIFGCKTSVIPSYVESIDGYAFYGNGGLTSIEIPRSVKAIYSSAFMDCVNMTSIFIPDSVTVMGTEVFRGCANLTIYCQAVSRPDGWAFYWSGANIPVHWGRESAE